MTKKHYVGLFEDLLAFVERADKAEEIGNTDIDTEIEENEEA